MTAAANKTHKKDAYWSYIILAFGITWFFWGMGLALNQSKGYVLPAPGNIILLLENGFENSEHILISMLFALATYGPLFAGVYAIKREKGREGLSRLWKSIYTINFSGIWFVRMLVVSFIISGLPFLVAVLTGWLPNPGELLQSLIPFFITVFVWQMLSSGLGEEPGWRGYLLRKLQDRHEGTRPIWILGLIWALWHYPFTIYWTLNGIGGEETAVIIITLITALAGFTISIIGLTHLHVWFYNNTGSVLLAILFHAFNNAFPTIFTVASIPQLAVLLGFMPWLVVIYLERRLGKKNFPGPIKA